MQAQTDDDAVRAAARRLGEQGIEAYSAGDYGTAAAKLDQGFRLYPSPTLGLWCARARVQLERLVEASERYREAVRAPVPSVGNNAAQQEAKQEAERELAALLPRIPSLTVKLAVPNPQAVQLTLDGTEFPNALVGAIRPTNPGTHDLVATRGAETQLITVRLVEGQQQTVSVDFKKTAPSVTANESAPAGPDVVRADAVPAPSSLEPVRSADTARGAFTLGVRFSALSYEYVALNYYTPSISITFKGLEAFGVPQLELGYGITNRFWLGLGLSVRARKETHYGELTAIVSVLPTYEFPTASIVRPIIGAVLSAALHPEDSNGASDWRVLVGARMGVRIFASQSLSIDCALFGHGGAGRGKQKAPNLDVFEPDQVIWGPLTHWQVGLQLGATAWIY